MTYFDLNVDIAARHHYIYFGKCMPEVDCYRSRLFILPDVHGIEQIDVAVIYEIGN